MDNLAHNHHIFVGPWDQFVMNYPDNAREYAANYNHTAFHQSSEKDIPLENATVFYCMSGEPQFLLLHEYQHMLTHNSLIIIIVAPLVTIHVFDNISLRNVTVHVVIQRAAACVYEHDMMSEATIEPLKRHSVITAYDDATVHYYALCAGDTSLEHTYYSDTRGRNSQTFLRGIFCALKKQQITVHSVQNHAHPSTQSEVLLKGFVAHNASMFYKGTISIAQDAINTIAGQEHKTLLLSEKASVESIPVLEVLNKEVRCSHASAVGMFDVEAFLYLQSRGLSKNKARQILLFSYIESVYKNEHALILLDKKIAFLINSFDFL